MLKDNGAALAASNAKFVFPVAPKLAGANGSFAAVDYRCACVEAESRQNTFYFVLFDGAHTHAHTPPSPPSLHPAP